MISIIGNVVSGAGQAREISVPTANLNLEHLPDSGIYAAKVILEGDTYNATAYIGKSWLLEGAPERVEVHLFDYDGDSFYGKSIQVDLLKKLRDPIEFTTQEQAEEQIKQDLAQAKAFLL